MFTCLSCIVPLPKHKQNTTHQLQQHEHRAKTIHTNGGPQPFWLQAFIRIERDGRLSYKERCKTSCERAILLQPCGDGVHALQHAVRAVQAQRRDATSGVTRMEAVKQDQTRVFYHHLAVQQDQEGVDASSVEGGTACPFRAERVSGNTGRGGEEDSRGHGKHGQGKRQAGRGPGAHAPESEGNDDFVRVRGDPGEATGRERGEPVKDYLAWLSF